MKPALRLEPVLDPAYDRTIFRLHCGMSWTARLEQPLESEKNLLR